MGANTRSRRLQWFVAIAVAALLAVLLVVFWGSGRAAQNEPGSERGSQAKGTANGQSPSARALPPSLDPDRPDVAVGQRSEPPPVDVGETDNEYPVDLDDLRARLPDNLYWQMGVPTEDPRILRAREEDKKRWNELHGKVLSNTATEEEVRRYYEHRRQVSEDYIEFASLVLEEYGDRLPERDRGMYELSIEMHSARLAEIPRQIEDALARKEVQDRRREEWRRSQ